MEQRRNGLYYYRSLRVGSQVTKEYYGGGEDALMIAELDAIKRETQTEREQAWKREQAELAAADTLVAELDAQVSDLMREELNAANFHQHHRGEWRRRRTA